MLERTVFFISDQTGVTAETLGHSLLTQFDGVKFNSMTVPFVDSVEKAKEVSKRIDKEIQRRRPVAIKIHNQCLIAVYFFMVLHVMHEGLDALARS